MFRPNPYPWVEIVNPKSEPTFTEDQIIEKMVEMFGDNLANPDHYPRIVKRQFELAKLELSRQPVTATVPVPTVS